MTLMTFHRNRCAEETDAAAQDQRIGAQALLDFEGNLIAGIGKLPHRIIFSSLLDLKAGNNSGQQPDAKNRPGRPCFRG